MTKLLLWTNASEIYYMSNIYSAKKKSYDISNTTGTHDNSMVNSCQITSQESRKILLYN